ncbi:hypothetical protein K6119_09530 [Paracrocinitomix mangrovi]|uniref:hypothetical protein n=1 Tax=Paracrocinitomix mangrovi TaxID=2862509 RepID=UPI001C8D951E|nr:hypothetical protein [Paracrocinitomix mangrovi]UKN03731.1 hypothetical protein K6119_09530 [Paracrocinitomix mangrovi]
MRTTLLTLLETKNFEQLTNDERLLVLSEMTAEEYLEQRKIILATKSLAAQERKTLQANPSILLAAQNKFNTNQKAVKKGGLLLLWQHKIPSWAAVAACILLMFSVWGFNEYNQDTTERTVITEIVRDTVYQDKIVEVTVPQKADTIVKIVYKNVPSEDKEEPIQIASNYNVSEDLINPNFEYTDHQYCSVLPCNDLSTGLSRANDSISMMFR